MTVLKCRICGDSYRSESHRCLASLTQLSATIIYETKICHQLGVREFQAVLRAKAAERSAIPSPNLIDIILGHTCELKLDRYSVCSIAFVVQ